MLRVYGISVARGDATQTITVEVNTRRARYYQSMTIKGWDDMTEDERFETEQTVFDFPEFTSEELGPDQWAGLRVAVTGMLADGGYARIDAASDFYVQRTSASGLGTETPELPCDDPATFEDGRPVVGWCAAGGTFTVPITSGRDGASSQDFMLCFTTFTPEGACCGGETETEPPVVKPPITPPDPPTPPVIPPVDRPVITKHTMPLPGTSIVTTRSCARTAATSSTGPVCASSTDETRNPFNNTTANPAVSIRVEPSSVSVVNGRRAKIRVVAVFDDGQEGDVTDLATFNSPNSAIAESLGSGFIAGRSVGTAFVETTWGAFSGRCEVTVSAAGCVDEDPRDVVLVVDQNLGSAFFPFQDFEAWSSATAASPVRQMYWHSTDQTSIDLFDELLAQAQCALSLRNAYDVDDAGTDRMAVVLTGDGDPITASTWSSTAGSLSFSAHYADVRLGQALQRAGTLLASALEGSATLVVVVTASGGNGCSPSASSAATVLKNAGHKVAVVTPLAANSTVYSACSYPSKAFSAMQSMASSGLFYGNTTYAELGNTLGGVLADACA